MFLLISAYGPESSRHRGLARLLRIREDNLDNAFACEVWTICGAKSILAFRSFGHVARLSSRVVIHNILGFIPLIDQEMAIFHIIKPYWEIRVEVMVCIRLKLLP